MPKWGWAQPYDPLSTDQLSQWIDADNGNGNRMNANGTGIEFPKCADCIRWIWKEEEEGSGIWRYANVWGEDTN